MANDTRFQKELSFELNEICNKYVHLHKESKQDCIKDYTTVVSNIMKELQNTDILFKKLYTEIFFTGSYYDGLRVSEASEFDLDVILKLPMNPGEIEVDIKKIPPGFAKVNVSSGIKNLRKHPKYTEEYRNLDDWITDNGFIEEERVRIWFQSILSKCLNKKEELNWKDNMGQSYKVTYKNSGPAITLKIGRKGVPIDVDLVPVIKFEGPDKWPNMPVRQCTYKAKSYFVVPKKKPDATKCYWRLAFPMQEKEIFHGKENLKTTLKIFKKLRDVNNWKFLSSYYIKTIFLWEVENQKNVKDFWNKNLGFLFLHMLNRLRECLELKRIKFFWHTDCNLLEAAYVKSDKAIENAYFRVNKIIEAINKEPKNVKLVRNYLVSAEDEAKVKIPRGIFDSDCVVVSYEEVGASRPSQPNLETVPAANSDSRCCIS